MKWWFGSALWMRILIGMALGIAVGFALRPGGLAASAGLDVAGIDAGLKLIGDAFIRLIRMLAVPLIFVSVTAAVVSIADLSKLGKSGADAEAYAKSVVVADFEEAGDEDVVRKVKNDFALAGVSVTDTEIRTVMTELLIKAADDIQAAR